MLAAHLTAFPDVRAEFERILDELEKLAMLLIVHKKKFEYSLNQFRRFLTDFSDNLPQGYLTQKQIEKKREMIDALYNIRELLLSYDKHRWTTHTVDNPSNTVGTALTGIALRLRKASEALYPQGSVQFDPESPQWMQYHLFDLKCIDISFKNFVNTCDKTDNGYPLVIKRLQSIENFIERYQTADPSPGVRVFSPVPVDYQSWKISRDNLIFKKPIGTGVSATVYYGFDKRNMNEVAIKEMKFNVLSGQKLQAFQREIAILATAVHPCLLGFIGATETPPYCIVTDWMGGGTLYSEIHTTHRLNPTQLSIVIYDIARGMQFLHSRHIVHRDLKSLNILLDTRGKAHIADFGFSRREDEHMTQNVGTPHWMAPELLMSGESYSSKIDVYAFAIVMWELLAQDYPYPDLEPSQIIGAVLMNDIRPSIPDRAPQAYVDLMTKCWDRNPEQRPSFDDIIQKLQTGDIVLPGTDRQAFIQYTDQFAEEVSDHTIHIESQLEERSESEEKFATFVDTIEKEGIPPNLVDRCWSKFAGAHNIRPELRGRAAVLFLKTSMRSAVGHVLRELPNNSIPYTSMMSAVELLPTGSEETDTDIVVAACRNGCADAASVYAIEPSHVKLALEMVAQHGVSVNLRAAVADRCVQCLGSADFATVCAAVRCLVGIGEIRRITPTAIRTHMGSPEPAVRACVFVAAAALAREGIAVPGEFATALVGHLGEEPLAATCVISACSQEDVATLAIDRVVEGGVPPEVAMRILLASHRHEGLRPRIVEALKVLSATGDVKGEVGAAGDQLLKAFGEEPLFNV